MKITLTFGFDNFRQLNYLRMALKSFKKSNINNTNIIDLLFVLDEKLKATPEEKEFDAFINEIIENDFVWKKVYLKKGSGSINKNGQFNYLYAPFYTKADYSICFDPDFIIHSNLNEIIEENISNLKNNLIAAVKTDVVDSWKQAKSVKAIKGAQYYEKWSKNWVNGGMVIINNKEWVNYFISKENLKSEIKNISLFNEQNIKNYEDSDEGFFIMTFPNKIGFLDSKNNIRLHVRESIGENIKNGTYNFHFMTKYYDSKKRDYIKFNWNHFFEEAGLEKRKLKAVKKFYIKTFKNWKRKFDKNEINEVVDNSKILLFDYMEIGGLNEK